MQQPHPKPPDQSFTSISTNIEAPPPATTMRNLSSPDLGHRRALRRSSAPTAAISPLQPHPKPPDQSFTSISTNIEAPPPATTMRNLSSPDLGHRRALRRSSAPTAAISPLVVVGLWVLSLMGNCFNFLTLFYICFVLLQTVPVLYEKYEDQVDAFAEKAEAELKKHYVVFNVKVLSKIPKVGLSEPMFTALFFTTFGLIVLRIVYNIELNDVYNIVLVNVKLQPHPKPPDQSFTSISTNIEAPPPATTMRNLSSPDLGHRRALRRSSAPTAAISPLVVVGLWVLSLMGNCFNFLTLFYICFVLLQTVPVLYEKYEDQVDAFAEKAEAELKKHYVVFNVKVLSKIPKGSLKYKKFA
ncbi:hypothetical protein BUALT_Bualt11G0014100 [Buddleja alternifolia]|uniref:Reticulon-like protein n=1 Tax=Buddleja alternifolia TaxID=168488 RepID=A0AAV6WS24_9LAMI|nr:hypothetical protein BUALT_Bualt11G0014100 [Buddleja alternifolia]